MSTPTSSARAPGSILGGQYRIERFLGEGGMGAVYQATPLNAPGYTVALKVLHSEMAANSNVVERFLAEGDVCRRLDHPGILRVHDIGQDAGVPYLVMDLLEGRSLVEYTEHQQRLPLDFAVTVSLGILHALEYAHTRGIVHRDLKPENVFLVPTPDGRFHTKILDFGIAKTIDAAGGPRKRTATGVLLGTPGYMSPEQVTGSRSVDHRTDLWAVGVMFYEMVVGATAFPPDGDNPNNIWGLISAVLTKEAVPLSVYDPRLAPYERFIARALAKDANARYPSAREMGEDLLGIARGGAAVVHGRGDAGAIRGRDVGATNGGDGAPTPIAHARPGDAHAGHVDSRGELSAIPPLVNEMGRTVLAREPFVQGLPQAMPAPAPIIRTFPTGISSHELSGTAPMPPTPQQVIGSGTAVSVHTPPAQAPAYTSALGSTLPTSPVQGGPPPPSRFGTSPSGYAPVAGDSRPPGGGAAAYIPPNSAGEASAEGAGAGVIVWVLVALGLVLALAGGVVWMLS